MIDLRTLKPLDEATLPRSVRKSGRLVVVHEAAAPCGVGAEIAALVSEQAFEALKSPVRRLTGPDAPAPSWVLEQAGVPQPGRPSCARRRGWCCVMRCRRDPAPQGGSPGRPLGLDGDLSRARRRSARRRRARGAARRRRRGNGRRGSPGARHPDAPCSTRSVTARPAASAATGRRRARSARGDGSLSMLASGGSWPSVSARPPIGNRPSAA